MKYKVLKVILFIVACLPVSYSYGQLQPHTQHIPLNQGVNSSFAEFDNTIFSVFGAHASLSNGPYKLSETDFAIKGQSSFLGNYYQPDDSFEIIKNAPLYLLGCGYVFSQADLKKDDFQTDQYTTHSLLLSFARLLPSMTHAISFGIQPGMVYNQFDKNGFTCNANVAYLGRLDKKTNLLESNDEILDQMVYNYISIGINNLFNPFATISKLDSFTARPARTLQLSFQETFLDLTSTRFMIDGMAMYGGNTVFMAGPAVDFHLQQRYYDRIRLGAQYKSTGYIAYNAGIRLHDQYTGKLGINLNIGYNQALANAVYPAEKGWYFAVSLLFLDNGGGSCKNNQYPAPDATIASLQK